jgi:hypothetical protein
MAQAQIVRHFAEKFDFFKIFSSFRFMRPIKMAIYVLCILPKADKGGFRWMLAP